MSFVRGKSWLTKLAMLAKDAVFSAPAKAAAFVDSPPKFLYNSYKSSSSEISYSKMSSSEIKTLFETWRSEYGKIYKTPDEKLHRFGIFKDTLRFIEEKNKVISFRVGLNEFSDLTPEEVTARYCGLLTPDETREHQRDIEAIGLRMYFSTEREHMDTYQKGSVMYKLSNDPELKAAISDPEVMAALRDGMVNPANLEKHQANPKVALVLAKILSAIAGPNLVDFLGPKD